MSVLSSQITSLPAIISQQFLPHSQPQTQRIHIRPGLCSLPGGVGLPPDVIFQRRPQLQHHLFTAPVSWRAVETEASSGLVGDQSPVRSVVVDIPGQVGGGAGHWRDTGSTQGFSHNITLSQSQDPGAQLGQIYQVLS